MLLHHYLEHTAARSPGQTAVQTDEGRLTFADLDSRANALARGLAGAGVRRGDRVVIYLDNRIDTVAAIFGVLKAGAAFVMVNPSTKDDKLTYLVRHTGASAIVMPCGRAATLAPRRDELPSIRTLVVTGADDVAWRETTLLRLSEVVAEDGLALPSTVIDLDLAALLYTSGSSGHPKGVMLTHANVCAAIDSIAEYLSLTADDRLMNILPLSFGYGLTQLFSAVKVGAPFILERGMLFPHVTLTRLAQERVTGFAMVPTVATVLLGLDLSKYDLSSLRYITNAGAGLPTAHVRQMRQALPEVDLFLMYGQTECLRISHLRPEEVDARPDSVGRGIPNQELAIVDEDGSPTAPGQTGELVVRGSHVMRGYWEMPEETALKLRPGRYPGETVLHTGDLFRQDADGYLYFVARSDDIIKSKGEKVSPREVENALFRLDAIAEAAVVGVSDTIEGQAVKAVIVLRPGAELTAREVQRHCAGCLEDFMVPSVVEFRDSLPKSDNGKVLKGSLTKQLAAV